MVGIKTELLRLDAKIRQEELEKIIEKLNKDDSIDGILLQLPIPKHLDEKYNINLIDPKKDIDGFTLFNQGKLFQKINTVNPATPQGIINLLDEYKIELSKLNAVVVGRSQIVGLPIFKMLLDKNATVTICHSKSQDISIYTKKADLIIMAVGKPKMLKKDMVKKDAIIVDVGINRVDSKLIGDADFEELFSKVKYITPVPKGVGPMTINALLENIYKLSKNSRKEKDNHEHMA